MRKRRNIRVLTNSAARCSTNVSSSCRSSASLLFFIGRLLDLPASTLPESRAFPPEWRREAAFAALIGVLTIASFFLDALDWPGIGGWMRVLALGLYVGRRMPFRGRSFLANCLRVGIVTVLFGFAVVAAWPIYRVAGLHIVFITGFNLVVFTVAIRVVLWPQRQPRPAFETALVFHRHGRASLFGDDLALHRRSCPIRARPAFALGGHLLAGGIVSLDAQSHSEGHDQRTRMIQDAASSRQKFTAHAPSG